MSGDGVYRSRFAQVQYLASLFAARVLGAGHPAARDPRPAAGSNRIASEGISAANHLSDSGPVLPDADMRRGETAALSLVGLRPPVRGSGGEATISHLAKSYLSALAEGAAHAATHAAAAAESRTVKSRSEAAAYIARRDRLVSRGLPALEALPVAPSDASGAGEPRASSLYDMGSVILNAAMIPGWPAPRPFEMPRGIDRMARRAAPKVPGAREVAWRVTRDETAVHTYLANLGVKRGERDRIRNLLRPFKRRFKILFGLAVLVTQVTFVLHTILKEMDRLEDSRDDVDSDPGNWQRMTRG